VESLAQLREKLPEFEKLHVSLACIVQGTATDAEELCGPFGLTPSCIPDPQKESYAKIGLDRAKWKELLFPSDELRQRRKENRDAGFSISITRSLKATCDILLLPGAAIVARGGKILWLHRGANPADLPLANDLLEKVRQHV